MYKSFSILLLFVSIANSGWQYGFVPSEDNLKYVTSIYDYVFSKTYQNFQCSDKFVEVKINIEAPPKSILHNQHMNVSVCVENSRVKTIETQSNFDYHFIEYTCAVFDIANELKKDFDVTFNVLKDNTLFGLIYWPHNISLISLNILQYSYVHFYNETHLGIMMIFELKPKMRSNSRPDL